MSKQEECLRESWLVRQLVPLRDALYDFDVRYYKARNRVADLLRRSHDRDSAGYEPSGVASKILARRDDGIAKSHFVGAELPVRSTSGLTKGKVDRVFTDKRGLVLQDYKTGHIFDVSEGSDSDRIREEYRLQLRLYAALYYDTYEAWPDVVEIVDSSGRSWEVPADPAVCQLVLLEAEEVLRTIQRLVGETVEDLSIPVSEHEIRKLARPSADACRFCSFRPACSAYRHTERNTIEEDWPKDLIGNIESIEREASGRLRIEIETASGRLQWRGVSPTLERHPALQNVAPGQQLHVYEAARTREEHVFGESLLTTAYRILE